MKQKDLFTCMGLIVAGLLLFGDAGANTREPRQNETILVTAQKVEEDSRDVPVSMTVFDSLAIEDRQIESVKDIAPFTPNLMLFDNSGAGNFTTTIRGINSSGTSYSTSAALMIDGIPILFANGMDETLMDIERIEVLKGPQSTLYGKDTEAGAINIITKKPGNEFIAKLKAGLGSDDKRQYVFNLGGPIAKDNLYLGLSGQHYEKDGFIQNTYLNTIANDRKNNAGKMTLRWTPSEQLELVLTSSKAKRDDGRYNVNEISATEPEIHTNTEEYVETDSFMNALQIDYHRGNFKLSSITTHRNFEVESLTDYDYSLATGYHVLEECSYKKVSQEIRLSSINAGLSWLIGVYADKDDNHQDNTVIMASGSSPALRNFDGDAYGLFAHADYSLGEKTSLIAGLRYDRDNKVYEDEINGLNNEENSYSEISPKLALKYAANDHIMAYATAAKGYRSGGFHPYTAPGYKKGYDKETLWNYEIGLKTSFFDNRLFINGSIYYMDIDNMQVKSAVDQGLSYMSNAAKAASKGFEIEARAVVIEDLEIFASIGYNETEFDIFRDYNGDYSGNSNPYAPKYNYHVGAQYRNQCGVFARTDLHGYGKTYLDNANKYSRKPYHLVNLKAGYEAESYDIYLYAKNLFDTNYDTYGAYGGYYKIYSPQREVGVEVTYRF